MHREFLMGNEAMAVGALAAGVNVVAGYPGTPSTEVLEAVAGRRGEGVYVEWSVNEKAALEVAAGAAYAGARALVTMKQVGLNVASDPLMSLSYIGVKGGMVVLVADDPGPISSQTEQDTRTFAAYAKLPILDPSSPTEAYAMMGEAFDLSEELGCPVIVRPTTRVDHGYEDVEVADPEEWRVNEPEGFVRDPSRWVIFPALSVRAHAAIERRDALLAERLSRYARNTVRQTAGPDARPRLGIATHGISATYVAENLSEKDDVRVLRVATPYPFPEPLAADFLDGLDEVLCVEELDPVIERALVAACGRRGLHVKIRGKLTGDIQPSGENTVESVGRAIDAFLGREVADEPAPAGSSPRAVSQPRSGEDCLSTEKNPPAPPTLPIRPPVLCAGCPHRASFYAVKRAMRGRKTLFCGDIGCYTLGNAAPLDMVDTCLCMGAGINIAQGVTHVESDTVAFAFVGDSTFFASGITGVVNAFYNQANMTLVVLDNSTTAMTGHQPHPGTGRTMMGQVVEKVSIERVLLAIGLTVVETVDPLDHERAVETVRRVADEPGVKAIIFRSPCVVLARPKATSVVDVEKCVGCQRCVRELGCPALVPNSATGRVRIDSAQCTGCTLCEQICPTHAISGGERL
ncbi:indolepyruvate ferredoxin oxidoreductase subunit alpha [Thermophilibacter sp. ET337]|uniref:indolepyruvate ferredoxin oxidoreductase subunit alpha n=1 Tax=Thermophilibacter sp. ET337 TaxID=2973084 RepID=UPI0021ABB5FA|nr:indolepyruvate ferredoxin oxidoreductase subunit alpha [Thermophilibacter sp. ET337]MCR8908566.1 indolepyruvate ferredoxin oxidoreductase subunit alpha [Thermophilibacter sp. ET337]